MTGHKEKKKRNENHNNQRESEESKRNENGNSVITEPENPFFYEETPSYVSQNRNSIYTPLSPIQETNPHRRRELKRHRAVACVILEKCLSNLGVIAELQAGDKLGFTSTGDFVIHKPSWFNTFTRTIMGVDRWKTHEHIANLFGMAEAIVDEGNINDPRVRTALVNSVHGLRNLQCTYPQDSTIRNKLEVLLQRIEMRYGVDQQALLSIV